MKVLQEGIETNKHTSPVFVVATPLASGRAKPLPPPTSQVKKASSAYSHHVAAYQGVFRKYCPSCLLPHQPTKIQSLPIIGREWEYQFYVDIVFDNVLKYKQSIVAITPLTKELKILGEYEDGKSTI